MARPGPRPAWPIWRCTKDGSRMRSRTFEQGAAADLAAKNTDRAARKLTSLAHVHLLRGQKAAAIAAADKALRHQQCRADPVSGRSYFRRSRRNRQGAGAGRRLSAELAAEPQAYGKIIEGEIALKSGDARQAIKILTDANDILDTWLGHFDLGRAYLELGPFRRPTPSSIAVSSAAAKHCRCWWTRSRPTAISRSCTTIRDWSAKD